MAEREVEQETLLSSALETKLMDKKNTSHLVLLQNNACLWGMGCIKQDFSISSSSSTYLYPSCGLYMQFLQK